MSLSASCRHVARSKHKCSDFSIQGNRHSIPRLPTRLDVVERLAFRVFLLAASIAITTIIMIGALQGHYVLKTTVNTAFNSYPPNEMPAEDYGYNPVSQVMYHTRSEH